MRCDIASGDRLWSVDVEPDEEPGRFRVNLDGAVQRVEVHRLDARSLSLILVDRARRSAIAGVVDRGGGARTVHLRSGAIHLTVNGRQSAAAARGSGVSGQRLVAPMPGRVVSVLVKPGDQVTRDQPLIVVEAMKMENALVASGAGTVVEVAVAAGETVDAGRLLLVVE